MADLNKPIQERYTSIKDYQALVDKAPLQEYFMYLERDAVPVNIPPKDKRAACKPFNDKNIEVWQSARKLGAAIYGRVRCTFAYIYLPSDTGAVRVFSLQGKQFTDYPAIEDCGVGEVSTELTSAVFGTPAPCDVRDFINPDTLHVGKLTDTAYKFVQTCTNNRLQSPYILYRPDRFSWHFEFGECASIIPDTPAPTPVTPQQKKKSWLLALLAGAASILTD